MNIDEQKKKWFLIRYKNFLIGLLLIYFVFFGFVCNTGSTEQQQDPGNKLLFVYTAFFNNLHLKISGIFFYTFIQNMVEVIPCWISIFILIGIGIYQSYQYDFLVEAVKNNIWQVPFMVLISWIFYSINYRISPLTTLAIYFTSIHGYLNIITLLVVYGGSGVIGGYLKNRTQLKKQKFRILNESDQKK